MKKENEAQAEYILIMLNKASYNTDAHVKNMSTIIACSNKRVNNFISTEYFCKIEVCHIMHPFLDSWRFLCISV